jgi:phosphopantetheine--protein transferase-like protein
MKWSFTAPNPGDMVRIKSGELYHFGVYASDDEIIQFGLAPHARPHMKESEVEVIASDVDTFCQGGFLEVAEPDRKEQKKRRSPDEAISAARARIGERGYNIIANNCEHFAYECVFGIKYCSQTEAVRQFLKSLPLLHVYVCEVPNESKLSSLYPAERNREVNSIKNENVKREKYYVWKLLEYALDRSLGIKLKKAGIKKSENGKWKSSECEFSLSHSSGVLAVAISRKPVGVDIEKISAPRSERFAERILTEKEFNNYSAKEKSLSPEFLIEKWTQKESIFKSLDEKYFNPSKIETENASVRTERLTVNGEEYMLSVASQTPNRLKLVKDIELHSI